MPESAATMMQHAFGSVELKRWSPDPTRSLQAWDAADLYLLSLLQEYSTNLDSASVLLMNDEYGAMTVALGSGGFSGICLYCVNDSYIGRCAAEHNLELNGITADYRIESELSQKLPKFDVVLLKIPKSSAFLTDQLYRLRSHLKPDTQLYCAAMDKHLSPKVQQTFEGLLGTTQRMLSRKKARAFQVWPDLNRQPGTNPHPIRLTIKELPGPLLVHSAVFSQRRLDSGSIMLIKQLPEIRPRMRVIDLGCGAGVLGLYCLNKQPEAHVTFIDESSAAINSTKANINALFPGSNAVCLNQDCLDPAPVNPVELIVCNPPFHSNRNVLSATAERMFQQSLPALISGGQLLIVGNRHLEYAERLRRIFGRSTVLAQDNRYQVISARRR